MGMGHRGARISGKVISRAAPQHALHHIRIHTGGGVGFANFVQNLLTVNGGGFGGLDAQFHGFAAHVDDGDLDGAVNNDGFAQTSGKIEPFKGSLTSA